MIAYVPGHPRPDHGRSLQKGSNILAETVLGEVKPGDKVLDMGTGSGIQAIFAASKSTNVTAVDINPLAVQCAKLNVKLNKETF